MARTVNRNPYTVNVPSSSENKEYFFNHYNWKGMSDDKNFLTSDQETFEYCNNVYVDDEGLLRSRPSFKPASKRIDDGKLLNIWTVDDFIIYYWYKYSGPLPQYKLTFTKRSDIEYSETWDFSIGVFLISIGDEIHVFDSTGLSVFNKNTCTWDTSADESKYLYIPEVTIKSGVVTETGEAKNLLTKKQKVTYLYTPGDPYYSALLGKDVEVTVGHKLYPRLNISYDLLDRLYSEKTMISVTSSEPPKVGAINDALWTYDSNSNIFRYSPDGKTFTRQLNIKASKLKVSKDGTTLFFTNEGKLFRISLIKDLYVNNELTYRYPSEDFIIAPCQDFVFNTHDDGLILLTSSNEDIVGNFPRDGKGQYAVDMARFKSGNIDRFEVNRYEMEDLQVDYLQYYGSVLAISLIDDERVRVFCKYGYFDRGDNQLDLDMEQYRHITSDGMMSFYAADKVSINSNTDKIALVYHQTDDDGNDLSKGRYELSAFDVNQFIGYIRDGRLTESEDLSVFSNLLIDNDTIAYNNYMERISKRGKIVPLNAGESFIPLAIGNYVYYAVDDLTEPFVLYSTEPSEVTIKYIEDGTHDTIIGDLYKAKYLPFNGHVFSLNNSLYHTVTKYNDNSGFLWYIPDYTEEKLPEDVTNLVALSSSEFAALSEHQIWNVSVTDSGRTYHKSKLQAGLKNGANVLTLYGGDSILFANNRGLLSLGYKDFVATTDQSLNYLSDIIMKDFTDFCKGYAVNLVQYKHLIICYNGSDKFFFFDLRNNSWWPMTAPFTVDKIFILNDELLITSLIEQNKDAWYKFDYSDEDYKDCGTTTIPWNIKSQKLHLSAINYHKHISNIMLISVLDSNEPFDVKLKVTNYRNIKADSEVEVKEFRVDTIRTHVQRLSFPKVNEFQYELTNDDQKYIGVPLSLSGISIKYRIGGQVR